MPKKKIVDPKVKFQEGIERIRREFPAVFNSKVDKAKWLENMEGLYWEDAVLVLTGSKRTVQGKRQIAKYWWDFKHKKAGRKLKTLDFRFKVPRKFPVYLIGVVAKGEYNLYDMGAYDFCKFHFNPDGTDGGIVARYLHKRTCTTAIAEFFFDDRRPL